ncbi:MAG: hypothetical protein JSV86_21795 [Gemmatimonadota bacterium]|nr:MAG: hypothetical protein JSV86_21795 [Gemmatimonadota bacterium]
MTYVPTPTYGPRPSPQSQELAHKIEGVIREYRQTHPGMSPADVEQAVKLAQSRAGVGSSAVRAGVLILVALGLLLALGAAFFMQVT